MYRIGLLGLDGHQGVVLSAIPRQKDVCLAAIACERPESIEALKKHPAVTEKTTFHSDWEALLEKEELDIAVVCSINSLHAPMLKGAARRGLHIISEKPLALTLSDLAEVRQTIEKARIRLSMLITMRYSPCYRAAHELVRSGRIGKPVLAMMLKSYRLGKRPEWQRNRATFGGTIPFVNIHSVDLLRWITGCEFTECHAYHGNAGKPEAGDLEDHAVVLFRMNNGGVAVSQQDYLRPAAAASHGQAYLRIAGSEGLLEIQGEEAPVHLTTTSEPLHQPPLPEPEDYLEDFLNGIEGRSQHLISQEDCFRVSEIVLKAYEAANTGTRTPL